MAPQGLTPFVGQQLIQTPDGQMILCQQPQTIVAGSGAEGGNQVQVLQQNPVQGNGSSYI